MGWVDRIPGPGKLYIGGLQALYRKPEFFKQVGITHVLSVIDFDLYEKGQFSEYGQLHVRLDDDPNENLLEHFARGTAFIEEALSNGGGVFVHCAMGKSRSAAMICAYLMKRDSISPMEALEIVREGRPVAGPNPGFMDQLEVWHRMLQASNKHQSQSIYEGWLKDRFKGDAWSWEHRSLTSKI